MASGLQTVRLPILILLHLCRRSGICFAIENRMYLQHLGRSTRVMQKLAPWQ